MASSSLFIHFKTGDVVRITIAHATRAGEVTLASDNGRSLGIELRKPWILLGVPCDALAVFFTDDHEWREIFLGVRLEIDHLLMH